MLEVAANQRPDFLTLQIVGVVVAGRERETTEHDAALDLGAETLRARFFIQLDIVLGGYSQTEADAVVTREIRRGFGGRDQVVGGDCIRGVRQRNFDGGGRL